MKEVYVYCEGATEETFVRDILAPAFRGKQIFIKPSKFRNSHNSGGVSKYSKIKRYLNDLCQKNPNAIVTTMLDYYGLPSEVPGVRKGLIESALQHVEDIEAAIFEDIGVRNLIPNLLLYEFEALLFSDTTRFSCLGLSERTMKQLRDIREKADSPEHINNHPSTLMGG